MITWFSISLAICGWWAWYRVNREADELASEVERLEYQIEQMWEALEESL